MANLCKILANIPFEDGKNNEGLAKSQIPIFCALKRPCWPDKRSIRSILRHWEIPGDRDDLQARVRVQKTELYEAAGIVGRLSPWNA